MALGVEYSLAQTRFEGPAIRSSLQYVEQGREWVGATIGRTSLAKLSDERVYGAALPAEAALIVPSDASDDGRKQQDDGLSKAFDDRGEHRKRGREDVNIDDQHAVARYTR